VFFSLFQHLDRGKPHDNMRGWLFRVAHNLALKRRHRVQRDFEARAEASSKEFAIDPGPNPEDRMMNSQTQQGLFALAAGLCAVLTAGIVLARSDMGRQNSWRNHPGEPANGLRPSKS